MAKMNKHLNDVVDKLVDSAFEILQFRSLLALGNHDQMPKNWMSFDEEQQNLIIELVRPLLTSAQQTKKINAQTSQDVVALIKKGKISISEGKELLMLTKIRLDVENSEQKSEIQKKMLEMLNIQNKGE